VDEIDSCREAKKFNYCREVKKKIDTAVRRESPSGRMKSILAMRQRKIDYRCEAKKKSIRKNQLSP
jgi:hypothetical protein